MGKLLNWLWMGVVQQWPLVQDIRTKGKTSIKKAEVSHLVSSFRRRKTCFFRIFNFFLRAGIVEAFLSNRYITGPIAI